MTELVVTGTKEKILNYLGSGISAAQTASAVGVSESYIAQLISEEAFAVKVAELRMAKLTKYVETDELYDELEQKLAKNLKNAIPFMSDPMKIVRALKDINSLKRRGTSTTESVANAQVVVNLTLPVAIQNKLTIQTNVNNQVVKIGDQSMTTAPVSALKKLIAKNTEDVLVLENPNGQSSHPSRSP